MMILITALLAQVSPLTTVPAMRPFSLDASETCEGTAGPVDMARVMFLENRTLDVDGRTGPLRLSLVGETFRAEEIGENSERRAYRDRIDTLVQPGSNLDIELKLVVVNSRLMLYWRETYRHRTYRFGILTLEGRALFGDDTLGMTSFCQGEGGNSAF